ncbi:MAG: hypothetical protein P1U38_16100 [Aeromicrobium sp.]|uniref:hypothetical protein n=1 Tax=Aeromicrobium sp. TaxID=1871063 RepID=UPI00260CF9F4|nr:hypothetical protein [Aeromicrobium sp.]MDF1706292.1 hypothetical protein [Aeromicrobium sp.]
MTSDPALLGLAATDPDHYLVRRGEAGSGPGWRSAEELRDPQAWPAIARAYAADLGGAKVAIGGSCALQGYAWRVASLSVGRWAVSGRGIDLATADLRVQLRSGRTVGLALGALGVGAGPATPDAVSADLVAHLAPIVDASRTVSRLRPRVAWGNVASAVASAWRRVHDAVPQDRQPAVLRAARACLEAPAWPWDEVPIAWQAMEGTPLRYRRTTCCLIRLAPDHSACTSCSDIEPAESERRWSASEAARPVVPAIAVGAHVGR